MSHLLGSCLSCNKGIPPGYLAVVADWESVEWGKGFRVSVPKRMYCRPCGLNSEGLRQYQNRRAKLPEPPPVAVVMSQKEMAMAVFPHLSTAEARSSTKLAELAGLADTAIPAIKEIMKKLHAAGKVVFTEEKRWLKK